DNTLTRVFSGPFAEKSKAEAAKRALDEAFSLNSLVTSGDK
ncbi:MAG: SPOR domain-containing protein, partial [Marinobacter sp.]